MTVAAIDLTLATGSSRQAKARGRCGVTPA
jgi:hypothetical protein